MIKNNIQRTLGNGQGDLILIDVSNLSPYIPDKSYESERLRYMSQ